MTARTWSKERFSGRGYMLGVEAVYCELNELWYGGGNIHRTPFGGRNMQYYSEDGVMGCYVGWYEAERMQELGIMYGIKHFALNDQEANRESLATFANEQSIRETYLRAFEGPMCKGGSLGIMTGFNRIGCRYVATHTDLITDVLKGEWAFQGHVTTDAGDAGYKSHMLEQLAAGIDYTCWNTKTEDISAAIERGDGLALQLLRQSAKHNLYAASRSTSVNGLSSNTIVVTIIPAWQTALAVSACSLLSVMCLSRHRVVLSQQLPGVGGRAQRHYHVCLPGRAAPGDRYPDPSVPLRKSYPASSRQRRASDHETKLEKRRGRPYRRRFDGGTAGRLRHQRDEQRIVLPQREEAASDNYVKPQQGGGEGPDCTERGRNRPVSEHSGGSGNVFGTVPDAGHGGRVFGPARGCLPGHSGL